MPVFQISTNVKISNGKVLINLHANTIISYLRSLTSVTTYKQGPLVVYERYNT